MEAGEHWYAIQVKCRFEKAVAEQLRIRSFEPFLPVYKAIHNWSDRRKVIELPLFDGYLFCRFDTDVRVSILTIPHVIRIVGRGSVPTPIPPSEIAALQTVVASQVDCKPSPTVATGEWVRIEAGPLSGVEGVLVKSKNAATVVISVELLQRSVAVEVDLKHVAPVKTRSNAVHGRERR